MPTLLRRMTGRSAKTAPEETAPEETPEKAGADETTDAAVEETKAAVRAPAEEDAETTDEADAERAGETSAEHASEDEAEPETEASGSGESTVRRRAGAFRRLPRPAIQVLGLLVAVALVLSVAVGVLAFKVAAEQAAEEAGPKAMKQAKSSIQQVLSYDYRTIESDLAKGKSLATGDFRKEWERDAPRLLQVAQENKTVLQTVPMSAAVSSATEDQVVVLVFATQASTTAEDSRTKLGTPRLRVTMRLVEDKWLISRLQRL